MTNEVYQKRRPMLNLFPQWCIFFVREMRIIKSLFFCFVSWMELVISIGRGLLDDFSFLLPYALDQFLGDLDTTRKWMHYRVVFFFQYFGLLGWNIMLGTLRIRWRMLTLHGIEFVICLLFFFCFSFPSFDGNPFILQF